MNIDINKLEVIKDDLADLKNDQVLYIDENGKTKFVIMPVESYDNAEETLAKYDYFTNLGPKIKVIGLDNIELSYDEYETIRAGILEAVDKALKPKAEKMN